VGNQDQHVSLSDAALDTGLLKMDEALKENRRQLLLQHIVEGKSRSCAPTTREFSHVFGPLEGQLKFDPY